ncbi:MAG: hypothetical protein WDN03_14205 [Rhizomicrobium sp.]
MARKPAPKPNDPEQVKRFIEMAKAIEVDESDGAFEKALKKVVPPKRDAAS